MSQPTIPVCYRHPSRETYLRCSRCDKPICPDCMNEAAVGQHCPDCAGQGRRSQRSARTAFGGTLAGSQGHVTKALIGINVAVALLAVILGGTQAIAGGGGWGGLLGGTTELHLQGGMFAYGVAYGEWYRLVTSMFLHYGLFHLLLNMWALWIIGGVLEPLLGRLRFLALYLISGIGGSVAVFLFADPRVLTAGASGAVFGLFAAFFILQRKLGRDTSMITGILVLNLVITFLVPGISIAGHLGGMVTGGLVALGLAYAPRGRRDLVQSLALGGIVAILLVISIIRAGMLL